MCVCEREREEEVVEQSDFERERERERERELFGKYQVFCYIKPGYEFENRISKYKALGACAGVDHVNCGLFLFFYMKINFFLNK